MAYISSSSDRDINLCGKMCFSAAVLADVTPPSPEFLYMLRYSWLDVTKFLEHFLQESLSGPPTGERGGGGVNQMKKVRNLFTGRQESKQMLRGARSHNGEYMCSLLFVSTFWVMYICESHQILCCLHAQNT